MGSLFNWSDTFLTGIDSVDAQHLHLQALINGLAASALGATTEDSAGFSDSLEALEDYARSHFIEEEVLMQEGGRGSTLHPGAHCSAPEFFGGNCNPGPRPIQ
jgi:hemerythrin-like metal-binding protein